MKEFEPNVGVTILLLPYVTFTSPSWETGKKLREANRCVSFVSLLYYWFSRLFEPVCIHERLVPISVDVCALMWVCLSV